MTAVLLLAAWEVEQLEAMYRLVDFRGALRITDYVRILEQLTKVKDWSQ